METRVSSSMKEVVIGGGRPTVLIGERINPTGKKKLTEALKSGDMELVRKQALAQVMAGADIIEVNVGVAGADQVALLPQVVRVVMDTVDVPLCFDSDNPKALEAALRVYQGKAIINSVTGQERSLEEVLPLVKKYGSAVIGMTMDDGGIPSDADRRVTIARKIIDRANAVGIPPEDIIIDCLTLTVGADNKAGLVTIEAIRKIKAELGVNISLGVSNISFGLPDRGLLNSAFLAIAIAEGVTCVIVDVERVRPTVLAADLVMGYDKYAMHYIKAYKQRQNC